MTMVLDNERYKKIILAVLVLLCASFLLFFNLGYYALWDDEADTALFAQSVWRTGDTNALLDHNLVAHTDGMELKDLRNRYLPPLQFYLAAPFAGLAPGSSGAARWPFAFCGLLTIALMLYWLWRDQASIRIWGIASMGILGNVSLMLYFRQCRYYALTILLTTFLAYVYAHRDDRVRMAAIISLSMLLLLASNYLCYAAAIVCLALDYFIWGRKERGWTDAQWWIILSTQLFFGIWLVSTYNLSFQNMHATSTQSWLTDRFASLIWYLREMNNSEFCIGLLILVSPFLYWFDRNKLLVRLPAAIFVYACVISFLSPSSWHGFAINIRYLAPIIPICISAAVFSILALTKRLPWLAVPLTILAFATNGLNGGILRKEPQTVRYYNPKSLFSFRSTVYEYVRELSHPNPSAYGLTADWLNGHVPAGQSVAVFPGYAAYPLMYHASQMIYAWQLDEKKGQFSTLPDIHFRGEIPPEYVIAFGPFLGEATQAFNKLEARGVHYEQVGCIDRYWYDLTRPELFWHSFKEVKEFSRENEAIYIYKKV